MKIALVTPARAGTRNGNRHTALRWAAFLRAAGHRVIVETEWSGADVDLMLALHARRSHASIRRFADARPDRPLVLALTGTDVYRDIRESEAARESLRLADRYIVLQPMAALELPSALRRRVRVVVQSCSSRLHQRPIRRGFRACVIANLREEKDPLRACEALQQLDSPDVQIVQIGAGLEDALAARARAAMLADRRYRWLGTLPHSRTLQWLASSHAMVISSRMEGGANVVCEALRLGVPVIASRISGNIGLLGQDYPAYFPVEDERALALLLERCARDPVFYRSLKNRIAKLRAMVAPRQEARALAAAIAA